MIRTLGFFTEDSFISNLAGVVNTVGELSGLANTYARDVKIYNNSIGALNVYDTENITSAQALLSEAVHIQVAGILDNLGGWLQTNDTMLVKVTAAIGNYVNNIAVGNPILNIKTNTLYPEWIEFTFTENSLDWYYKIWLADAPFRLDYPKGQFEFIMPLDNMQLLYDNFALASAQAANIKLSHLIAKAHTQIHSVLTGYDTLTIRVFNIADTSSFFDLDILVAFNGGINYCNTAAYLNALASTLANGGSHSINDWLIIIPNLVPVNKYFFGVNWANTAISNLSLATPICSPSINPADITAYVNNVFHDYLPADITAKLNYSVAVYKSMGFFVLPDMANPDGALAFNVKFHDYFLSLINDINVEQMSRLTQYTVALLDQLLRIAENYTLGDVLPVDTATEVKNGFIYITKRILDVNVCVISRKSLLHLP